MVKEHLFITGAASADAIMEQVVQVAIIITKADSNKIKDTDEVFLKFSKITNDIALSRWRSRCSSRSISMVNLFSRFTYKLSEAKTSLTIYS